MSSRIMKFKVWLRSLSPLQAGIFYASVAWCLYLTIIHNPVLGYSIHRDFLDWYSWGALNGPDFLGDIDELKIYALWIFLSIVATVLFIWLTGIRSSNQISSGGKDARMESRIQHDEVNARQSVDYPVECIDEAANDLLRELQDNGVFIGRRKASIRREAIAYFGAKLAILADQTPDYAERIGALLSAIKSKSSASEIQYKNYHIDLGNGSMGGAYEVNLLDSTIDDRIEFYSANSRQHKGFYHLIPYAFGAGHILDGRNIAKMSLAELDEALREVSKDTEKNGIQFPDPRRDEVILGWLADNESRVMHKCSTSIEL